jgi:hypothetical protein
LYVGQGVNVKDQNGDKDGILMKNSFLAMDILLKKY